MIDFAYSAEITINATPQAIFDIVSNPANHAELAGSAELNTVRHEPAGQVGTGTRILVGETVKMADGSGMDLTADSVVVTYDAPNSFSWVVNAALPEQVPRIQWWFRMTPAGSGTKVSYDVEVDWGEVAHEMLISLRYNFEQVRASAVRSGMNQTVVNLKVFAESGGGGTFGRRSRKDPALPTRPEPSVRAALKLIHSLSTTEYGYGFLSPDGEGMPYIEVLDKLDVLGNGDKALTALHDLGLVNFTFGEIHLVTLSEKGDVTAVAEQSPALRPLRYAKSVAKSFLLTLDRDLDISLNIIGSIISWLIFSPLLIFETAILIYRRFFSLRNRKPN